MQSPKLSILVPTFNRAEYLEECIDSLLTTTVDCEIIISDNASTDGTEALVRRYTDSRIRYFRQSENIIISSYQFLYREARGEYLATIGDDDRILPGCYEKKIAILDRFSDIDLVYSLWNRIDPAGKFQGVVHWPGLTHHSYLGGRDEFCDMVVASYIMLQTVVIRRSLYDDWGAYDLGAGLEASVDWDQYIRYVQHAKTAFLHEPTVDIRVHPTSSTSSLGPQGAFDRDRLRIWRRHLLENRNPPVLSDLHWQWMAQSLQGEATHNVGADSPLIPELIEQFNKLRRDYFDKMEQIAADTLNGLRPAVIQGAPVAWLAPIFEPTGYADESRAFILYMREHGLELAARPMGQGTERFRAGLPPLQVARLDRAIAKPIAADAIIVVCMPGFGLQRVSDQAYMIGRTMYETDSVPADWVERCNQMDELWVPSHHAIEAFRHAGVTKRIERVPEGVDSIKFRPGLQPLPLPAEVSGTVFLSIFEWSHRKGWDVLLRAWATAFRPGEDVTLVIRAYPMNEGHTDGTVEIRNRIDTFLNDELGLSRTQVAPIVVLGDHVPDADMPSLYAAANAYVAPSRGEGWGRPHIEAMACGLPVIATRWGGNMDFMTEDNSLLIDVEAIVPVRAEIWTRETGHNVQGHRWAEPSVRSLVRHLRMVVDAPDQANAIGRRARASIVEHWRWELIAGIAQQRLLAIAEERSAAKRKQISATPASTPSPTAAPATLSPRSLRLEPFRLLWEGSQFVHHSLGHVNRELCASLIESGGVDLEIIPFEPDVFSPVRGSRLEMVKKRIGRTLKADAEVHVRHQWPPRFDAPPNGAWVMMQPWEHGHLPANWVQPMRDLVDEIWVPTSWVRDCYIASGVPEDKVVVITNGVDANQYRPDGPRFTLRTRKRIKLLFIGGAIFRKGIDLLVNTYLQTFSGADDICLVVKGFGSDSVYRGSETHQQLLRLDEVGQQDSSVAEIEYLPQSISDDEIAALYRACDVFVLPYRGEGFGMPIAEAMATGLPVVTTRYGACLDFCDETTAYLVPATRRAVEANGWRQHHGGHWVAEPSGEALSATLLHVVTNLDEARIKGARGRERIVRDFGWSRSAELILGRLSELSNRTPIRVQAQSTFFYRDAPPLPLKSRKRTAFLLHPDWHTELWQETLKTYVAAFGPNDDVTLVLWRDPHQSYSIRSFEETLNEILADVGLTKADAPDLLVVDDDLSLIGIGMLYAAVDCVLDSGDPVSALRAKASGKDFMSHTTTPALKKYARR
jgi:glycosyltransferase involved in cell wall biosynthesis